MKTETALKVTTCAGFATWRKQTRDALAAMKGDAPTYDILQLMAADLRALQGEYGKSKAVRHE